MKIRSACPGDAAAIAAIYAPMSSISQLSRCSARGHVRDGARRVVLRAPGPVKDLFGKRIISREQRVGSVSRAKNKQTFNGDRL